MITVNFHPTRANVEVENLDIHKRWELTKFSEEFIIMYFSHKADFKLCSDFKAWILKHENDF